MTQLDQFQTIVTAKNGRITFSYQGHPSDHLNMRAAQLRSLLLLTYGNQGETFRDLRPDIQDEVMWLASTLADEVFMLAGLEGSDGEVME